jgi:hypothetical protein
MKLRRLTDTGIEAFSNYLAKLRAEPTLAPPVQLLDSPGVSEPLKTDAAVEPRPFATRLDAAEYLHGLLAGSGLVGLDRDRGLWTWLTLYYFDQLCPADGHGKRKAGENARYIAELMNYKRYYRHLLAGPFYIYNAHSDCPQRAKAILVSKIHMPGDIVEQVASRQEIVTNKSVMDVITHLYICSDDDSVKRGAGGKTNGAARRLTDVLGQLELNFDLYLIAPDKLLDLLPTEFNRFRD